MMIVPFACGKVMFLWISGRRFTEGRFIYKIPMTTCRICKNKEGEHGNIHEKSATWQKL